MNEFLHDDRADDEHQEQDEHQEVQDRKANNPAPSELSLLERVNRRTNLTTVHLVSFISYYPRVPTHT